MKKLFLVLAFTGFILPVSLQAGNLDYKTLGVGPVIGEPIGLNGRYFFTDQIAFDMTVGYAPVDGVFEFAPSALVYFRRIFEFDGPNFTVVPYSGGGLRTGPGVARLHDGNWFGAFRIPIGVAIVIATLSQLARQGKVSALVVEEAIREFKIDPLSPNPMRV